MNAMKQRHGCVTFWLWAVILANLGVLAYYSVSMFGAYSPMLSLSMGCQSVMSVVMILGAIQLMRWNKVGFYLMIAASVISGLVEILLLKAAPYYAVSLLVAILIWWAILQIKKNGSSAWSLMQGGWDYAHCRHLYQVFAGVMALMVILTIVAYLSDHEGNPYEKMLDEYESSMEEVVDLLEDSTLQDDTVEIMDSVAVYDVPVAVEPDPEEKIMDKATKPVNSEPVDDSELVDRGEPVSVMDDEPESDNSEAVVEKAVEFLKNAIATVELPMDIGSGMSMTQMKVGSYYLVCTVSCDEAYLDMDLLRQNKAEVKKNMLNMLKTGADPNVQTVVLLCLKAHKGMLYTYIGDTSGKECSVGLTYEELKEFSGDQN